MTELKALIDAVIGDDEWEIDRARVRHQAVLVQPPVPRPNTGRLLYNHTRPPQRYYPSALVQQQHNITDDDKRPVTPPPLPRAQKTFQPRITRIQDEDDEDLQLAISASLQLSREPSSTTASCSTWCNDDDQDGLDDRLLNVDEREALRRAMRESEVEQFRTEWHAEITRKAHEPIK